MIWLQYTICGQRQFRRVIQTVCGHWHYTNIIDILLITANMSKQTNLFLTRRRILRSQLDEITIWHFPTFNIGKMSLTRQKGGKWTSIATLWFPLRFIICWIVDISVAWFGFRRFLYVWHNGMEFSSDSFFSFQLLTRKFSLYKTNLCN